MGQVLISIILTVEHSEAFFLSRIEAVQKIFKWRKTKKRFQDPSQVFRASAS